MYVLAGQIAGLALVRQPRREWRPDSAGESKVEGIMQLEGGRPDELELRREEMESGKREAWGKAIMNKYLDIDRHDHGAAESFLSNVLNPKVPLQLAMADTESGATLSTGEAIQKLTHRFLERSEGGSEGNPEFKKWVREEVKRMRASARIEVLLESDCCFCWKLVMTALHGAGRRQSSMRLPRVAARASLLGARIFVWTLLNLAGASGLTPSGWIREVTPTRKRGHGPVTDAVLRPVSYVDEIENPFDACWLAGPRHLLEAYMGEQQSGGA